MRSTVKPHPAIARRSAAAAGIAPAEPDQPGLSGAADEDLRGLAALAAGRSSMRLLALASELAEARATLARTEQALAHARTELAEARRLAERDALTGLPNRRAFDRLTQRPGANGAGGAALLAVLLIDLDDFKPVNDRLGHATGDALLRIVAERLAGALRRADFVCRLGGDEFLCVLPDLNSAAHARSVARKLLRVIAAPCRIGPHGVRVHASIGVAVHPRQGSDVAWLYRRADAAMLNAKALGGGLAMADLADPAPGGAVAIG